MNSFLFAGPALVETGLYRYKRVISRFIATVAVVAALFSAGVAAETLPKAELGLGFATQHLKDYRGSSHAQIQAVPFPILIYRGERIRADKDGIRGRFLQGENWELNASAEAALNGGSGDNKKRQGMPELNSAAEIGPSLNINLTGRDFEEGWSLRMPLRAVFAVDTQGIEAIGYTANPKFTYRQPAFWAGWDGKLDFGALWGSQAYHEYYYSVDSVFATAERPSYQANAGYSGAYFKTTLKKRMGKWWIGWNLRYDNIHNSVFADSPLVETDHYFSTTFAVGWFFWHSD